MTTLSDYGIKTNTLPFKSVSYTNIYTYHEWKSHHSVARLECQQNNLLTREPFHTNHYSQTASFLDAPPESSAPCSPIP